MRNIFRWSVLVLLLLSSCAAKPHTVALQDALKVGDYENAYTILDKVCNENPEESVCGEMEEVRKRYGEVMISRLQGILDAEARPIPLARLAELNREVSEIGEMGLDEELTTVRETLIREEEDSRASAQESTREAVALFEKGMMREAFDRYKTALTLDGGIQKDFDTFKKMTLTELNRKGEEATEKDDWRTAHKAYQDAASIDVGYDNIEKRAKEAAERDSLDFYLAESDRAEKEGDYTRAVKLQKFALSYGETDELRTRFIEKSIRCTSELFNTVARQVDGEKPLSAGVTFLEAMELLSGVPEERRVEIVIPADRVTRLLDEFYVKGRKLKEEGRSELAYLYLRTLRGIQPNYPGVVEVMEALEGEIKNRAIKSLAVIPFKGPSYYVDAGAVLTSNILNFMHRELSRDVRILERGAIEDLLQESVVKTLQSGADTSGLLQLSGADYLLLGNVVNYKVESNVFDTHKTVRARTATKKVPNPEYEVWQKKRKGDEPPKELEEPVLEDIKRKVTHHRKTAIVAVSYRIVDSKGFVVYTGVTEKKVEAEDDSMEGIEIGEFKAPMKIARIPTDHEILNTAENEVLRKMHEELKKLFASSEKRLLREAQTLEDGRYYREALKKSVGALFILKNKGLETEKVESRIKELIREGRL